MRTLAPILAALIAIAGSACKKSSSTDETAGLPPATDWSAPDPAPSSAAGGSDPHGGMGMGGAADPHAGMDMGGGVDPHAGMDMGGGADPHAGMDMAGAGGGDPAMAAMQPPDPSRPIDRSKFLRGKIQATDETRSLIKSGAVVFLSVRPIEPTSGDIIGSPVAVDRIDVTQLPMEFSLDESNAMSSGTSFQGDVVIIARVDGDREARTKEPGDIEGSVRAKIPAENLVLNLDTLLR